MEEEQVLSIGYDRFFHYSISGLEAEELLQHESNGTFLVRESASLPGEFALSVKNEDGILHVRVYHDPVGRNIYRIVPKDNFFTLASLIEHYVNRPMIQHCGNAVRLKQPLMSTRFTAATVDERIDCLGKVAKKANYRDGIAEEYEKLHHSKGPHLFLSCKEGRKAENVRKNRYRNVVPYDHTRVKLDVESNDDPDRNDYINASLVEVLSEGVMYSEFKGLSKRYISTQGCLQNTVDDFWHMIWQLNCRVIVMTTKEMERGRLKCHKYWPDLDEDDQVYGRDKEFRLRSLKEDNCGEYVVRLLKLRRNSKGTNKEVSVRHIFHFQFLGWEDQTSPSGQLLQFMEEVNVCYEEKCPPNSGPIVVHCSAGIGRTGTFIVLDILLTKIKLQGPHCALDIFKTVRMVREQRATMVQTEGQYRFIYEAISKYMKMHHPRELIKPKKPLNGHEMRKEKFMDADDKY